MASALVHAAGLLLVGIDQPQQQREKTKRRRVNESLPDRALRNKAAQHRSREHSRSGIWPTESLSTGHRYPTELVLGQELPQLCTALFETTPVRGVDDIDLRRKQRDKREG